MTVYVASARTSQLTYKSHPTSFYTTGDYLIPHLKKHTSFTQGGPKDGTYIHTHIPEAAAWIFS